jgi:thiamine-phosphate pyrophosphorylase
VHATGVGLFRAALEQMKPERIVGAGGLTSRHDSMLAAELGADYVMFGEPDDQGVRPGFDAILDRVAWWSELFEVPSVAYAAHLDEVAPLVASGADFIALAPGIWTGADGLPAIAEARRRLVAREVV